MTLLHAVLILVAGVAAGAINAVVGSGTLITFPTLVALGYAPVTATMSNAIGLVLGGVSGTWGYRRELKGQADRLVWQEVNVLPLYQRPQSVGVRSTLANIGASGFFDLRYPDIGFTS